MRRIHFLLSNNGAPPNSLRKSASQGARTGGELTSKDAPLRRGAWADSPPLHVVQHLLVDAAVRRLGNALVQIAGQPGRHRHALLQ